MKEAFTLIPKNGNLNKLKYWKPIKLLCLDSKTLTKILANRLKKDSLSDYIRRTECLNTTENGLQELILTRDLIRYTKGKKKKKALSTSYK